MTTTTKLKTRSRVLSSPSVCPSLSLSLSLSLYVQEEFLKQKGSSFFLRDLWISRMLSEACGRTEAIYLYSISLKLGTYTKFLLLLLRYATMPLSLPAPRAFPPVHLPASHRPNLNRSNWEAQQQVQKRKDHTTKSTRQGSYLMIPCIS
jgi:hypothetical protein